MSITVKEYVAERLMVEAGWPLEERENNLEWDPELPDSQYSIMLDISESAIHYTLEALDMLESQEIQEEQEQFPERLNEKINSSGTSYLFLEEGGNTVEDVRRWVAEADAMGVPDYFTVEGYLHLMFDENYELISKKHPSVISKSDSDIRRLELETARRKIDHLIKEGNYVEAERVLEYVRKKEESLDS